MGQFASTASRAEPPAPLSPVLPPCPCPCPAPQAAQKRRHDVLKQNKEGNNIRCSLLALIRVVRALAARVKGDTKVHVPYRDSKLTRLLGNAVGGNSETVLICTLNPTEYRETMCTLHFAAVAQEVRGTPRPMTVQLDSNQALQQYKTEMGKLKQLLEEVWHCYNAPSPPPSSVWDRHRAVKEGKSGGSVGTTSRGKGRGSREQRAT